MTYDHWKTSNPADETLGPGDDNEGINMSSQDEDHSDTKQHKIAMLVREMMNAITQLYARRLLDEESRELLWLEKVELEAACFILQALLHELRKPLKVA